MQPKLFEKEAFTQPRLGKTLRVDRGAQPAEQALQPRRMPKVAAFMPDADEVLEFAREHRVSSIIFICLTLVLLEWVKAKFSPARDLAQQARMKRMFKKGVIKAKKR